jgi:hypothetical protein
MDWTQLAPGVLANTVGVGAAVWLAGRTASAEARRRRRDADQQRARARLRDLAHELADNAGSFTSIGGLACETSPACGCLNAANAAAKHLRFVAWECLLRGGRGDLPPVLVAALHAAASSTRDAEATVQVCATLVRERATRALLESEESDPAAIARLRSSERKLAGCVGPRVARALVQILGARRALAEHLAKPSAGDRAP